VAVKEVVVMDWRQEEALWRYSLIREAADPRLSCGERGALVRLLAARLHAHPSGELRSIGRSTLDDWIRAYRAGGFEALARFAPGTGPSAYSGTNGYFYVYYPGSDGKIHLMLLNGSVWCDQTLGGSVAADSSPSA
jgi:hypothetical protein